MALYCSPSVSPKISSQFRKQFAINSLSVAKSPNLFIPNPNFSRNSFFIPSVVTKSSFLNPQLCSSSSSSSSFEQETEPLSTSIIFVKGLPKPTSEERLKTAFSKFGDVDQVKVQTDKKTKQPLCFAYIWFQNEESARSAVQEMDGKFFDGRFIRVMIAKGGSFKSRFKTPPVKF